MSIRRAMVVFSDLDGTLLDPHTHSARDAKVGLDRLAAARIPLVFCSSKTRAEIEHIQQELDVEHPFICENGGGVFVPSGYFSFPVPGARDVAGYQAVELGRPYADVVDRLQTTAKRLSIEIVGFSDMSVEELACECQMPLLQARLAKLREYDEAFRLIEPSTAARSRLIKALRAARLSCTHGGRYEHAGAPVDKGWGVSLLSALYRRIHPVLTTVGLGDAANDVALLKGVNHPVIVRTDNAAVSQLQREIPAARVTAATGTSGWVEAVARLVDAAEAQPAER